MAQLLEGRKSKIISVLATICALVSMVSGIVVNSPIPALAATVTRYCTSYTVITGTWTNPANITGAADLVYAQSPEPSFELQVGGFDNTDPGGTITDVTIYWRYYTTGFSSSGGDTWKLEAAIDGTNYTTTIRAASTDNLGSAGSPVTSSVSLGALTLAQIGTLKSRVVGTKVAAADTAYFYGDAVWIVITYTPGETLTVTHTPKPTADVTQGTTNTITSVLKLAAPAGDGITVNSIKVNETGTSLDSDVSSVKLIDDADKSETFNLGDSIISSGTFSGGTITFSSLGYSMAASSSRWILIAFDASSTAIVGRTVVTNLANETYITVASPDTVAAFTNYTSGTFTLTDSPDNLTVSQTSVDDGSGNNLPRGSTHLMQVLDLSANQDRVTVSSITVTRTGTAQDSDTIAGGIKLFHDVNDNNTYEPGTDTQLSSSKTFSSGTVTFDSVNFEVVSGIPEKFLVTYDVSPTAVLSRTISSQIDSSSQVSVSSPDTVSLTATPLTAVTHTITEVGGYNSPQQYTTPPKGPHGGYAASTNKCKDCHAPHNATGTYRLLRADTKMNACQYCHDITGVGSGTNIVNDTSGHTMGYVGSSPDNEDAAPFSTGSDGFNCFACHTPHDALTVQLAGYATTKLLLKNPNPDSATEFTSSSYLSEWCSDCHSANFGIHTFPKIVGGSAKYGHDVSGTGMSTTADGWADVNPNDGVNKGPTCRQCHTAEAGSGTAKFPHSGGSSPSLLKSGANSDELDYVCASSCHNTVSLP